MITATCARCGQPFQRERRGDRLALYCSRDCSNRTANERAQERMAREGPCWPWWGALDRGGYGKVSVAGRTVQAHRWIYEQLRGPIPEDLTVDHTCERRDCANPWHLDLVTRGENTARSWRRGRHEAKRRVR